MSVAPAIRVAGPYFDELEVGDRFTDVPAQTLTSGAAALHQAVVGDRLRLALDADLARRVTGSGPLAHPALVWDVAIGQSTVATQRVIANLFYRGLALRRLPCLGDTLHTVTEVVALRETTRREGRPPTGLAVLRITTVDQDDREVLDFWRCAMLPLSRGASPTGRDDDLDAVPSGLAADALAASWADWDLDQLRTTHLRTGDMWDVEGADVVTCAPELARLTLNVASAHHDRTANTTRRRLVYGGHTIGIAAAQVTRALPDLVTFAGWHGCDHLAPVFEEDLLRSTISVVRRDGPLVDLRVLVIAERSGGGSEAVLDWRPVVVVA
jgi:acyl dehydratase